MKKIAERMRGCIETLSLSALLVINLSFMVLLMLGLCTVLVVTGADGGFIYHDGRIGIWGALCFIYAVCSLIAVSMVVMMRMVFIHPLQRNIEAMKKLANGDFTVRVNHAEHGYVPREMVEFEQSFNKAAEELGGTEILRKDFINNFSHEFKTPIVSISGFADLLLEEQLPPEDQKEYLYIIHRYRVGAIRTQNVLFFAVTRRIWRTDTKICQIRSGEDLFRGIKGNLFSFMQQQDSVTVECQFFHFLFDHKNSDTGFRKQFYRMEYFLTSLWIQL